MTLAILVPVLGRPHQIDPLLENIEAATDVDHRVVFICSRNDDTRLVCEKTKAETIVVPWEPGRGDFARKINLAYSSLDDDWFFQGATDLLFHQGWATKAMQAAQRSQVGVIGTNDLGNPAVIRGTHSTHIVFSRHYIETCGGTFDDSGKVFCEEYDHQFVDTEFVQTATLRRSFAPCKFSVVEHLHPHWGKGEMDDTYVKSERSFHEDMALYNSRMRRIRQVVQRCPPAG